MIRSNFIFGSKKECSFYINGLFENDSNNYINYQVWPRIYKSNILVSLSVNLFVFKEFVNKSKIFKLSKYAVKTDCLSNSKVFGLAFSN